MGGSSAVGAGPAQPRREKMEGLKGGACMAGSGMKIAVARREHESGTGSWSASSGDEGDMHRDWTALTSHRASA